MPGNREFLRKFEDWLRRRKIDMTGQVSTINKATGHIGYYNDSLLHYMSANKPGFSLMSFIELQSDNLIELPDPLGWIMGPRTESCKKVDDPSRKIEKMKANARLIDFVRETLEDSEVNDLHILTKRDHFVRRLQNLTDRIKDGKVLSKLKRMERVERRALQKAKVTLNPGTFYNEQQAITVWFNSAEAVEEDVSFQASWENCMSGKSISRREFTNAACYARFMTCLESQNRAAAFDFSNRAFLERFEKWLPEVSEDWMVVPENWNFNEPSVPGMDPSCYVIELSGAERGMKMGEATDVVLTKRSHDVCLKYAEMKETVLGPCDDSANFFVNSRGLPLAPMVRKKGSLLYKFGQVTGVSNFSTNSLRRGMEYKIQRDSNLLHHIKKIQSHTRKVGAEYYDKSGSDVRASVLCQLSEKQSPYKGDSGITAQIAEKRGDKRRAELEQNADAAKKKLFDRKLNRNMTLGKRCRVLPKDRYFMQKLFSNADCGEIFINTRNGFPGISFGSY